MENIILPTDLFARMQDLDLDAHQQLVYLALVLNRPVNMTGVYVLRRRELLGHLLPTIESQAVILAAVDVLKEKGLIYYQDDVLFIPLIPETSKLSRHNYRARMNSYVEKLRRTRTNNTALSAYEKWYQTNVREDEKNEEKLDASVSENEKKKLQKSKKLNKKTSKTTKSSSKVKNTELTTSTKAVTGVPLKRHRPSPKNGVPLSISISSSISSSSSLSSGKARQGGAGELNGLGDYQVFEDASRDGAMAGEQNSNHAGDDEYG